MAEIDIKTNLPNLEAHIKRLGAEFGKKVARPALSAATSVLARYVRSLAPVLKPENQRKGRVAGLLKRSIYSKRSKESTSGREHYFIGVRQGKKAEKKNRNAFYWRFLEGGWMPRGPGKKLTGGNRSRALQRRRAIAGGAQKVSYPFIQPAFIAGKEKALARFYAVSDRIIRKQSEERTK